jgi:acyl-coenzyme A synthetase/AMP-(fatty) acid ligase
MKTVDIVFATPSMLACHEPEAYPNIKQLMVAGEVLPQSLADKWARHTKLSNCCGPTEVSIINAVQAHTPGYPLSIGKPIANTSVYILSRDPSSTTPLPIGRVGCIWVGGMGVAGYLNLPETTAERFKPDPFVGNGGTMYNTGDLGRWRKDGQLDHLGRADNQVKFKGFRVELDGVATAMRTYEPVQNAVALVIGTEIWGFITPSTVDLSLVRDTTAKLQPYYAVPSQYLAMDHFPITRYGKVDTRSLSALVESDGCHGLKRLSVRNVRVQSIPSPLGTPDSINGQAWVETKTISPLSPQPLHPQPLLT